MPILSGPIDVRGRHPNLRQLQFGDSLALLQRNLDFGKVTRRPLLVPPRLFDALIQDQLLELSRNSIAEQGKPWK